MTRAILHAPPDRRMVETLTDGELNHAKRTLKQALSIVKAERKRRSERKKAQGK